MIKITKKFILVMLVAVLTFLSCATIALAHTREGGENVSNIATVITDDLLVDSKFNAYSEKVTSTNVEIYNYNSNVRKQCTGSTERINYIGNEDKCFLELSEPASSSIQQLDYSFMFDGTRDTYTNIATILYRDAVMFNGLKYNLKVDLKELSKVRQTLYLDIIIGQREKSEENKLDISTYGTYFPNIGMNFEDEGIQAQDCHAELKMAFSLVDNDGNVCPISGFLTFPAISKGKGYYLNNFQANSSNTYILDTNNNDNIKYKTDSNGTYIYSATTSTTNNGAVYVRYEDQATIELTYTSDGYIKDARQTFGFANSKLPRLPQIVTKVTGGTITETQANIPVGENRTIEFAPNNADAQYLKSVYIDGEAQEITGNEASYTFENISNAHTIEVIYGNKNKVTFDAKEGTPVPDAQYLLDDEKVTAPSIEPTREGYKFLGWKLSGETANYDFTKAVTGDITLEAVWEKTEENTTDEKEDNKEDDKKGDDETGKGKPYDGSEADKEIANAGATSVVLFILVIAVGAVISYFKFAKYKNIK